MVIFLSYVNVYPMVREMIVNTTTIVVVEGNGLISA